MLIRFAFAAADAGVTVGATSSIAATAIAEAVLIMGPLA
jgi:hypothetical protein